MADILKVKDEFGKWRVIPALKGDPGHDAKFIGAEATINDAVGIPKVNVVLGTQKDPVTQQEYQTIKFNFENLKGSVGATALANYIRGTFNTWSDVPSSESGYLPDPDNLTQPRYGDWLFVAHDENHGGQSYLYRYNDPDALGPSVKTFCAYKATVPTSSQDYSQDLILYTTHNTLNLGDELYMYSPTSSVIAILFGAGLEDIGALQTPLAALSNMSESSCFNYLMNTLHNGSMGVNDRNGYPIIVSEDTKSTWNYTREAISAFNSYVVEDAEQAHKAFLIPADERPHSIGKVRARFGTTGIRSVRNGDSYFESEEDGVTILMRSEEDDIELNSPGEFDKSHWLPIGAISNLNNIDASLSQKSLIVNYSDITYSNTIEQSTVIGNGAGSKSDYTIALGTDAKIEENATNSIQIGTGTATEANSMYVGSMEDPANPTNWKLLDLSTGKIPSDRITLADNLILQEKELDYLPPLDTNETELQVLPGETVYQYVGETNEYTHNYLYQPNYVQEEDISNWLNKSFTPTSWKILNINKERFFNAFNQWKDRTSHNNIIFSPTFDLAYSTADGWKITYRDIISNQITQLEVMSDEDLPLTSVESIHDIMGINLDNFTEPTGLGNYTVSSLTILDKFYIESVRGVDTKPTSIARKLFYNTLETLFDTTVKSSLTFSYSATTDLWTISQVDFETEEEIHNYVIDSTQLHDVYGIEVITPLVDDSFQILVNVNNALRWTQVEVQPDNGTWGAISGNIEEQEDLVKFVAKYKVMPEASVKYDGTIAQYLGPTTSDYTNGYFYQCVQTITDYEWQNIKVQPSYADKIVINNGVMTANSEGEITWTISHTLGDKMLMSSIYKKMSDDTYREVFPVVSQEINTIKVVFTGFTPQASLAADTYKAVIITGE